MKKRLTILASVLLLLLMMVIPSAYAAPNTARGFNVNNAGYDGVRAVLSTGVGTGSPPAFAFTAKSPDVFQYFAEQVHPKNGCMVVDVIQQKVANVAGTTHTLVLGNFCTGGTYNGGPVSFDLTNATFRSTYVRTNTYNDTGTAYQDEVVDVRLVQTNAGTNEWSFYIYNATTAAWDFKTSISGTTTQAAGYIDIGDGGYTQDATMSCPTLYPWGILEIRGIQLRKSGVWNWMAAGDINSNIADSWPCLTTNNYQERTSANFYKLEPYGVGY